MLWIPIQIWHNLRSELNQRSAGRRESGAFLLGQIAGSTRVVTSFVPYDELNAILAPRLISLPCGAYQRLWATCRERNLEVVGDIHCHPGKAYQSESDADHPMVPEIRHASVIVPEYARYVPEPETLGLYEYLGNLRWRDWSGSNWNRFLSFDEPPDGNN